MISRRFALFATFGVVGFVVDAGVLWGLTSLDMNVFAARLISFGCAVTSTWYLNRTFTFKPGPTRLLVEWARFVSANAIGGLINYATFAVAVWQVAFVASYPILGVALGSIAGLAWNYTASKRFVFSSRSDEK
ncbi:MAG: GtrA family protein [Pseudomonadota bacterium]